MRKSMICLVALIFCASVSFAQAVIQGKVVDRNGQPLEGASIKEKGTNNGTTTDKDGNYSIRVTNGEVVLIFSGVGLSDQEVNARGRAYLNINMSAKTVNLGTVEIVGTRSLKRSATETPVPVDIIPVAKITNSIGQVDLNQILQYMAPSFNSNRQSGSDGADHLDPASLRGLGPDQTLVLVNGKRWHQSSLVNLFGSRGRGNTGTDLNTIPAASIERIEILRDGAAAQYGSDAIAGVINIILKSGVNQGTANVSTGANITGYGASLNGNTLGRKWLDSRADGLVINANVNYGFALKNNGFFNVTGDYLKRNKTFRPNYVDYNPDDARRKAGDASAESYSLFFNTGLKLKGNASFYAFGGVSHRNGSAYAYTRSPGSIRNIPAIYPNGFDPLIGSSINDQQVSAGIKTKIGGWNADFNANLGHNRFEYNVSKTLNASLLEASPTSFKAGGFELSQNSLSANFTRAFAGVAKGANVAFGTEIRQEQYKIFKGEVASYKQYGPVFAGLNDDGDSTFRPGGSQGFPGFQPTDETDQRRTNWGTYVDAELDATDYYLISAAIRAEHYSDFGWTANFKIANRIKFNDNFSLRASVSTGFRAPSLPQINFSNTFTNVAAGVISEVKLAPNSGELAKAIGIPALKQETSVNASVGFTAKPAKNFTLTVDAYNVSIKDRIILTGYFDESTAAIADILKANNIASAQFFTNSVNTSTKGLDIIAGYAFKVGKGRINTTFAGNFNSLKINKINKVDKLNDNSDNYFSKREQYFLRASAPKHKLSLITEYKLNKFSVNLRFTHFAGIEIINYKSFGDGAEADAALAAGNTALYNSIITDVYKPRLVTDLTFGLQVTPKLNIAVGGANILDVYPTRQDPAWTETGAQWDAVQMGMGGAYYFTKLSLKF